MPRAMWKGSISFGLVNIPVELYSAIAPKDVHFHLLDKQGKCRLRRKLYCPETGQEYDFDETARGIEIAPDQYVLVHADELERLQPEAGRVIQIIDFIKRVGQAILLKESGTLGRNPRCLVKRA